MTASASPVPPRRAKRGRAAPPLPEGETFVRAARAPRVAAGGGGGARPVTSPPARGEPPSPAPRAALCPFPVSFPWWRRGRAGAGRRPARVGARGRQWAGRQARGGGKPCGSGGLCGPRPSRRAGRVVRSPRRRRRLRGGGGALSRARLPTHPAAPGLWRREEAGSLSAAPGPEAPRPPQAARGAAGRTAGPSLAPPAPLAAANPAGPALGGRRWDRSRSGRQSLRALEGPGAGC